MSERFFVDSPISAETALLSGPEARHLTKVMRVGVGEVVILFDGAGAEFQARVTHLGKAEVQLQILQRDDIDRELASRIILAAALPKGDRQRWLIEKCVELGVEQLVPLRTSRGVAQPTEQALRRLQRSVVEACKQCGRNRLMLVGPAQDLADFLALEAPPATQRWIADLAGQPLTCGDLAGGEYRFVVGPEGGFAPREIEQAAEHGWRRVNLGARTLRVETAAIALASLVSLLPR